METKATDLKLIDELLIDYMRIVGLQPHELESYSTVTRDCINRLRRAWRTGEMPEITMTWAEYFKRREVI